MQGQPRPMNGAPMGGPRPNQPVGRPMNGPPMGNPPAGARPMGNPPVGVRPGGPNQPGMRPSGPPPNNSSTGNLFGNPLGGKPQ